MMSSERSSIEKQVAAQQEKKHLLENEIFAKAKL